VKLETITVSEESDPDVTEVIKKPTIKSQKSSDQVITDGGEKRGISSLINNAEQ
jgi:hypothetical protein